MGGFSLGDPRLTHHHQIHRRHGSVVEEIEGLIRVYKDGHVDRLPIVRDVPCTWEPEPGVISRDVIIDHATRLWARLYVPLRQSPAATNLPLLVYFHGGGFCVASAAWSCYHEFLSRLAARAGCVVVSVNYRLAPEHRLPAAYNDGVNVVKWVRQQVVHAGDGTTPWWSSQCDVSVLFVGGDSAGATIAHNVAMQVPAGVAGVILIQPFFGGEARTSSEKHLSQPSSSALTLPVLDTYWRLALPVGSNRDHHYSNPLVGSRRADNVRQLPGFLVFIAELDILRDREVEFCRAMRAAGKNVEMVVHGGVGHAFHVLNSSRLARRRAQELVEQIKSFIGSR